MICVNPVSEMLQSLEMGFYYLKKSIRLFKDDMERKYVITYDICDPKRLNKVAKIMKDYGVRVQKSIFEAALNPRQLEILKSRIKKVMDLDLDGVKFFLLCPKCDQKVNIIGKGITTDLIQARMII
jgi:CRISPR-associated protein Cas2